MILYLFNVLLFVLEVGTLIYKCTVIFWYEFVYLFRERPRQDVANKIVLITGAGSGVGREMAIRFAKLNAILVLWDIDDVSDIFSDFLTILKMTLLHKHSVNETANEIRRIGGIAHPMVVDVSKEHKVEKMAERVKEEVGDVYMLVNNAGVCPCLRFKEIDYQQIRRTLDVNLLSHFWVCISLPVISGHKTYRNLMTKECGTS